MKVVCTDRKDPFSLVQWYRTDGGINYFKVYIGFHFRGRRSCIYCSSPGLYSSV